MADIYGDEENNALTGTDGADQITGDGGNDTISGQGGNDTIYGDYGPEGPGAGSALDATELNMDIDNAQNESADGTSVEYLDIAFLDDGTAVMGVLTLLETSNSSLSVDLTGGNGYEILLNGNGKKDMRDETATFRLEFYNQETGEPGLDQHCGHFRRH